MNNKLITSYLKNSLCCLTLFGLKREDLEGWRLSIMQVIVVGLLFVE